MEGSATRGGSGEGGLRHAEGSSSTGEEQAINMGMLRGGCGNGSCGARLSAGHAHYNNPKV
jgi:hypothetical protein